MINGKEFTIFEVNHNGVNHAVYIASDDILKYDDYYPHTHTAVIHDADGNVVKGIWQHGRTGQKRYEHPVRYNLKHNEIVEVSDYCYGQIRNNSRYLRKILWT